MPEEITFIRHSFLPGLGIGLSIKSSFIPFASLAWALTHNVFIRRAHILLIAAKAYVVSKGKSILKLRLIFSITISSILSRYYILTYCNLGRQEINGKNL